MNDIQRYFVEEFVEEYREGRMSRRDMVRRVLLITGGVGSAATTLLAMGCGTDSGSSGASSGTTAPPAATIARVETPAATTAAVAGLSATSAPATGARGAATMPPATNSADLIVQEDDPSIRAERVQFSGPAGTVFGYLARPAAATAVPGIIVVHENQGLQEPNMDIARRYAKEGFAALAVDLVSREGGTEKFLSDPAQIPAFLSRTPQPDLTADLAAGIAYLMTLDGVRNQGFGVTGFCFGGALTFALATASPDIRAAVPYYGTARVEDLPKSQAAFLIFYGETDTRITGQASDVERALRDAGRPVEVRIESGAGHAFFNNSGRAYNAAAARDAWPRTLDWFARYL